MRLMFYATTDKKAGVIDISSIIRMGDFCFKVTCSDGKTISFWNNKVSPSEPGYERTLLRFDDMTEDLFCNLLYEESAKLTIEHCSFEG